MWEMDWQVCEADEVELPPDSRAAEPAAADRWLGRYTGGPL